MDLQFLIPISADIGPYLLCNNSRKEITFRNYIFAVMDLSSTLGVTFTLTFGNFREKCCSAESRKSNNTVEEQFTEMLVHGATRATCTLRRNNFPLYAASIGKNGHERKL